MVEASNGIIACVEHRRPADRQSDETGLARRARLRDAPRVARVAAGAARRNANRGRPGRHGHHRPAVQAALWAASSVHAIMMGNLWISVAADAIAVVSPISGPGTARQRVRLLALVALIGTGLNAPLAVIGPTALNLAALLFFGLALFLAAQTRHCVSSPLWHARRQLLGSVHGPVVEVSNLASACRPEPGWRSSRRSAATPTTRERPSSPMPTGSPASASTAPSDSNRSSPDLSPGHLRSSFAALTGRPWARRSRFRRRIPNATSGDRHRHARHFWEHSDSGFSGGACLRNRHDRGG